MAQSSVSTTTGKPQKPEKPEGCPLFPHASGRWAKKINGQFAYFGPWRDLPGALAKYAREREDLEAGRQPTPADAVGLTIRDLCNRFLTVKRKRADSGEIAEGTFRDYHATCARLVDVFGKTRLVENLTPDDFEKLRDEIGKTRGPVALGNEIGRVRVVFNHAYNPKKGVLLISRPVNFGDSFNKPSKKVLRKERAKRGKKMFEADELGLLMGKAGIPLKAMIFLGINAGLGQSDVSNLPFEALDLDGGWLNYPRPKTGIDRRCPLWPETVAALRDAIRERPQPSNAEDADCVFITKPGNRWVRTLKAGTAEEKNEKWTNIDSVSLQFRKLMAAVKLNGHRNFYCLRRTFETIGGDSLDQVAVDSIMGHAPDGDDMSATYRQLVKDERLQKVADFVHAWLFPPKTETTQPRGA